jgi:hypothetical protein
MPVYPLQKIRRAYESVVETALASEAIPVYTDNAYYAEKKAQDEFALVRLSFGDMHELTVGSMMERIMGTLIVEIFVAKGKGPGRAQDLAEAALIGLARLNLALPDPDAEVLARTGIVSGPRLTPLQSAPHFMARLSCSIRASYTEVAVAPLAPVVFVLPGGTALVTSDDLVLVF